jgi:uncharacterized iron-regulated membrane protein
MNRFLYLAHRWIAAIAFVQLAVWTASGTFFTLFPIEDVRGRSVEGAHEASLTPGPGVVSPSTAIALAGQYGLPDPAAVELRARPQGMFYVARKAHHTVRIDARTGARADVSREEAESTAQRDQVGSPRVVSADLLLTAPVEYRGKPLPALRVTLADAHETRVFVDARTGDVTARRTGLWRTYDFLWSLHIMDYGDRESFHHPLITVAASLALLTVISGSVLWVTRVVRRLRRRPAVNRNTNT